jgi:hypothetical protein
MVRGIQVVVGLGLAGLLLVLGYGLLGEPQKGRLADRAGSRPAAPAPVAPQAAGEAGSHVSQAVVAQPEGAEENPGQTPGVMFRERDGQPPRLPLQIANLVRSQNLEKVIEKYARQYGVNQDLVWAVIRQESGFNPHAVSPKGAMGLMQLMPGTAALMGVTDAFDVEQNIAGGIKYLERCLSRFNQDVSLALAAYNAGPDNVVKYQGCPPFPETRHYVASILKAYAGETIREDLKLIGLSPVMDEDGLEPERPQGLAWRVPRPQWRIATPQYKLGSPRWKVSLLPF